MAKGKNKGSDERPSRPARGSSGKHNKRGETRHHVVAGKFHTKLAMWVRFDNRCVLIFPCTNHILRILTIVIPSVVVGRS